MVLTRATDYAAEDALHRRRGALRRERVSGQGLPLARPGSDLRRWHPPAARRGLSRRRRLARRRRRAAHSRSGRRRWRCGRTRRPFAWCCRRRWRKRAHRCDGRDLHVGDFANGILPAAAPLAIGSLTIAGMALAFARDGSGPRGAVVHRRRRIVAGRVARGDQSVRCAPSARGLLPWRTIRRRSRPRSASSLRSASSPTRRQATGYRASRSTVPIRTKSRRRSRGPWSGRGQDEGRRSSSSSRCGCAATRITTTCSTSAGIRSRGGTIRRCSAQGYADPDLYAFWSARDPIPGYARRLELDGVIDEGELERLKDEMRRASSSSRPQEVIAAPWPDGCAGW